MSAMPDAAVSDSPRWFCVQTKPRAEETALEHLSRQHYRCFLPRIRVVRLRAGCRSRVIEPLFPRYLFLQAQPAVESLAPVRSTRGVIGLVRFGDRIAEAPDVLVRQLMDDADEGGLILQPDSDFQPGDRVRIVEGSLLGVEGVYSQRRGEDRALVLLSLLGSQQCVVLPATSLERLPRSAV